MISVKITFTSHHTKYFNLPKDVATRLYRDFSCGSCARGYIAESIMLNLYHVEMIELSDV